MKVTAKVVRSGDWWAIEVPAIRGLRSQARRLDQVADQVIDAAALFDIDVTDVELDVELDDAEQRLVQEAQTTRREAQQVQAAASNAARCAVHTLRERGLTVRDVAAVMDLSPQRVSVLDRDAARDEGHSIGSARTRGGRT